MCQSYKWLLYIHCYFLFIEVNVRDRGHCRGSRWRKGGDQHRRPEVLTLFRLLGTGTRNKVSFTDSKTLLLFCLVSFIVASSSIFGGKVLRSGGGCLWCRALTSLPFCTSPVWTWLPDLLTPPSASPSLNQWQILGQDLCQYFIFTVFPLQT